jgi:hypothetical protein
MCDKSKLGQKMTLQAIEPGSLLSRATAANIIAVAGVVLLQMVLLQKSLLIRLLWLWCCKHCCGITLDLAVASPI